MKMPATFVLLSLFLLLSGKSALGQSADEMLGNSAMQAGNISDAFNKYMAAWQNADVGNEELRAKIINTAQKLQTPPSIPEDAKTHAVRAEEFAKLASTQSDYSNAAKELEKAVQIAPWNGRLYFNLATVEELAGDTKSAISNYNLYLLALPQAGDASVVKVKIAALEAKLEEIQKRKMLIRFMTGTWDSQNPIKINDQDGDSNGFKLEVNVSDDGPAEVTLYPRKDSGVSYKFKGSLQGDKAVVQISDVGQQGTDTGKITVTKTGSLLRARVSFTANGRTYTYDDFLDR